jgi:hypothetical protein
MSVALTLPSDATARLASAPANTTPPKHRAACRRPLGMATEPRQPFWAAAPPPNPAPAPSGGFSRGVLTRKRHSPGQGACRRPGSPRGGRARHHRPGHPVQERQG